MKFSINVPVYNAERYLPRCLEALAGQDFDDYEIVIVNDGSIDSSPAICAEFQEAHKGMVRLIEQENRGLLLARCAGISKARGEYCVFVDADDVLKSDALSTINRAIQESGADVVVFGASRDENFSRSCFSYDALIDASRAGGAEGLAAARKMFASSPNLNSMWSKAVRKECLGTQAELSRFGKLQMAEDALQTAILFDRAETVMAIPDILYWYRVNDESITLQKESAHLLLSDLNRAYAYIVTVVQGWDKSLLPFLYATWCRAMLSCLNRALVASKDETKNDRARIIEDFYNDEVFLSAYSQADFSVSPTWTKLLLKLLVEGRAGVYLFCIDHLYESARRR